MQLQRKSKQQKTFLNKNNKNKKLRGGAVYTFDFNEKIGGLPARVPLNGTQDGDCPASPVSELGFTNYGMVRGGRRHLKHKKSKRHTRKSHTHKSKTHKNHKYKK